MKVLFVIFYLLPFSFNYKFLFFYYYLLFQYELDHSLWFKYVNTLNEENKSYMHKGLGLVLLVLFPLLVYINHVD